MFMGVTPTILRPSLLSAILKPQDVFATSLYTGTGSLQTVTTGIDIPGKGGMIWEKARSNTFPHSLVDTLRGTSKYLQSQATDAEINGSGLTATSTGYTQTISSGTTMAGWSFARATKFFDIVTWTGDGTSNRLIPHGLGVVPGFITAKGRSAAGTWLSTHRGLTSPLTGRVYLNLTNAQDAPSAAVFPSAATDTTFSVGTALNNAGDTYVAYLVAHDPSADGIVQCGSFTLDSNFGASVNLGWQPQMLLLKTSSVPSGWIMFDAARGLGAQSRFLQANASQAEVGPGNYAAVSSTGFSLPAGQLYGSPSDVIYLAIRAPY